MSVAYQLKQEVEIKIKKPTKEIELEFEISDPDFSCVYVDGKYMDLETFSFDKNKVIFVKELEKGSSVKVRNFEKVGKPKRKRRNLDENVDD